MSISQNIKKIETNIGRWWDNKNKEWKQQDLEKKELQDLEKQAIKEGYKEEVVKMAKNHGKLKARLKYVKKPVANKSPIHDIIGKVDSMGKMFNEGIQDQYGSKNAKIGSNINSDMFKINNEEIGFLNTTKTIDNNLKKQKKPNKEEAKSTTPMDWGF